MPDSAPKPAKVVPPKPAQAKPKPKEQARSEKPKSDKPRGRPPELQKQLEEMLMFVGLMTAGAVDPFDGEVIRDNAASMAEAWHKVAQQNATVKRILNSMMETGAWSGAVAATAAVAVPILQNHRLVPDNIPHPFAKPPRLVAAEQQRQPAQHPHMPTPPQGGTQVPPQQGSPIAPSQAPQPPEPPPGQHRYGQPG